MEASIIICNKRKDKNLKDKIIFINALKDITRKNGESYLEECHISKIANAYRKHEEIPSFCIVVDLKEIESYKYDLTIQKYVFIKDETDTLKHDKYYFEEWSNICNSKNTSMLNLIDLIKR